MDSNTYGAGVAAEVSGLPWAQYMASVLPLRGRVPPYGLGLAPKAGPLGRVRDAVGGKVMEKGFGRAILPGLNAMRRVAGLAPLRSPIDNLRRADRLITLTGEPLEYPRTDLEPHVRMVGGQTWDPPAPAPDWLLGVVLPARRLEPQRLRAAVRAALAMPRRPRAEGSGERFADAAEELVPEAAVVA